MQSAVALPAIKPRSEELGLKAKSSCFFLLMILMAAVGWLAENTVKLVSQGVIDNRYHILPFIFPYGLAFLAMHIALGDTDALTVFGKKVFKEKTRRTAVLSNIIYVSVVCFFVFVGELAVGNFYELATGAVLWDYSALPLCLTKYVCLFSVIGYGVGAYLLMKLVFYPLLKLLYNRANLTAVLAVDCSLGTLVVLDSVCMIIITLVTGTAPVYWTLTVF